MKKLIVFGLVGSVLAASLLTAGLVFAQAPTPPGPDENGPAWGPMGNGHQGRYGQGMMNRAYRQGGIQGMHSGQGFMHETMVSAFAEALGLTPEELQTRLSAGDSMWAIAVERGLNQEQILEVMSAARNEALNQAVASGLISQDQADRMLSRMAQRQAAGYGQGNCHGAGRFGQGANNSP
jgi:hypothetical protein